MVLLWVQGTAVCTLLIVFICTLVNILAADTYLSPAPNIKMAKQAAATTAAAPQQLMFPGKLIDGVRCELAPGSVSALNNISGSRLMLMFFVVLQCPQGRPAWEETCRVV
jgi:hypothetical protein